MEVSIVLERNNATKESFTVNSNKPLGLDANNSFITIKLFEYFRNKISDKGYSEDATKCIMQKIEQCIPEDKVSVYLKHDDGDHKLNILVREISIKAYNRGITIDEKNLKEYLKHVRDENKHWL